MDVFLGDPESFVEAADLVFAELLGVESFQRALVRVVGVADQLGAHWSGFVGRELIGAQMFWGLLEEGVDPALAMLIVHYVSRG